MANDNEQFSEQEGDISQGESNTSAVQENTAPQVLTKEDILELLDAKLESNNLKVAEMTSRAVRAQQSMLDKKAAQIKTQAETHIKLLEDEGAQLTPQMKSNYVNRMVNTFVDSLRDEQPEPAQEKDLPEDYGSKVFDLAQVRVTKIAKKEGVTIEKDDLVVFDKHWKAVKDPVTYDEFLDFVEEYIHKKADHDETPANARIPSLAGGGAPSTLTAESYKKEVMSHDGDAKAIMAIKEKYKKAKVDVSQVRFTQSR